MDNYLVHLSKMTWHFPDSGVTVPLTFYLDDNKVLSVEALGHPCQEPGDSGRRVGVAVF